MNTTDIAKENLQPPKSLIGDPEHLVKKTQPGGSITDQKKGQNSVEPSAAAVNYPTANTKKPAAPFPSPHQTKLTQCLTNLTQSLTYILTTTEQTLNTHQSQLHTLSESQQGSLSQIEYYIQEVKKLSESLDGVVEKLVQEKCREEVGRLMKEYFRDVNQWRFGMDCKMDGLARSVRSQRRNELYKEGNVGTNMKKRTRSGLVWGREERKRKRDQSEYDTQEFDSTDDEVESTSEDDEDEDYQEEGYEEGTEIEGEKENDEEEKHDEEEEKRVKKRQKTEYGLMPMTQTRYNTKLSQSVTSRFTTPPSTANRAKPPNDIKSTYKSQAFRRKNSAPYPASNQYESNSDSASQYSALNNNYNALGNNTIQKTPAVSGIKKMRFRRKRFIPRFESRMCVRSRR